jgi:PAS domain S-box-containing protein
MIREWMRRLGLVKTILVITSIASLSAVLLYLLTSVITNDFSSIGIIRSAVIPMIITPILSFYFLKITIMLDQSEQALIRSEEKYRTILENIEDGYYEVDTRGKFIFFNNSLCEILGYSRSVLMGMSHRDIVEKNQLGRVNNVFNHVFTTGESFKGSDWKIIRPDGVKCQIDASVSLIEDGEKKPKGFRGIIRDITDRKNTEKALEESKEKYRQLLNHAPTGIYEIDFTKGKLTSANDVLCEYTGFTRDELLSMNVYDLMTKESQDRFIIRFEKLINGEKVPDAVEYQITTKHGKKIWILLNARYLYEDGKLRGATVVVHDIDERIKAEEEKHRLEDQLRQAQKMEAIGTLAGGIAHDFNNILSAIMGYTEVALLKISKDDHVKDYLHKVIKASNRARDMVRQILEFSRQSGFARKPIHVTQVVKDAAKLLNVSLPSTIDIRMDIDLSSGIIDADDIQIHQIIMNLCTNAAHEMKTKGGILGIKLSSVNLDEKDLAHQTEIKPGSFIKLSISDTGGGIPSEVMERMFDPYFTTKPQGEGTGLGLSIVHGLVKAHSGLITVDNDFGHGATFHVFLPKIENVIIPEKMDAIETPMPPGTEKILFVDDEPQVADVGKQMLDYLGYDVTSQISSVKALANFKSDPEKYDLVVTDMTMPELTGDKLAQQILDVRPDMPIIICTGHSENITEDQAREMGFKSFIMKPYLVHDLAKIVRQVLDE